MSAVACAKCNGAVSTDLSTRITVTIAPPIVVHYHPECYDPWAEEVGYGVTMTMEDQ